MTVDVYEAAGVKTCGIWVEDVEDMAWGRGESVDVLEIFGKAAGER